MSAESGASLQLSDQARGALRTILELLARERAAPSSVRDPEQAWRVHVADSLTGLEVEELRAARRIADLGAGAGFPGLPIAVALPEGRVDLIESTGRKCEFIRLAIERAGVANARVVCERSESWAAAPPPAGGREGYDAVAVRAVGRLSTLAELASPLLVEGGALVAWKGRRNEEEEAELERAARAPGDGAVGDQVGGSLRGLATSPPARAAKDGADPRQPPPAPRDGEEAPSGWRLKAGVGGPG